MFTASQPGEASRMGWRDPATHDEIPGIAEVVRNFYLKLWNTYSFFVTYANIDNFDPKAETVPLSERDLLDQWILSALNALVRDVTNAFENYDVIGATRPIEAFVDDLSNWYLRRSRRRFWQDENSKDKQAAYQTLYDCLVTLSKLLAPSMPFVAEELYQNLVVETGVSDVDSVHLAEWLAVDEDVIDEELNYQMSLVQRMVSLALAARNEAGIRVRQPLSEVYFGVPSAEKHADTLLEMQDVIADELNVKSVRLMDLKESADMVSYSVKPIDTLGRELRGDFPAVRNTLVSADENQVTSWSQKLLSGENIEVEANGKSFTLTPEQVVVRQESAEGFAVSAEHGYLAALNTELSEDLIREGKAREVVRNIQNLRKEADFELSDRIALTYKTDGELSEVMEAFKDYISTETLIEEWNAGSVANGEFSDTVEIDGDEMLISIRQL
jgi:isoleucyl-tRNA synthetase